MTSFEGTAVLEIRPYYLRASYSRIEVVFKTLIARVNNDQGKPYQGPALTERVEKEIRFTVKERTYSELRIF